MIEKIHIKNFKSLNDLDIDVGRINLFIGENGSGKSNLLEALVFVSASQSNKLDNEFLVSRGIRVTEPTLMRSAFEEKEGQDIEIIVNGRDYYKFKTSDDSYSKWVNVFEKEVYDNLLDTEEFHEFKSKISASIKKELFERLKSDINKDINNENISTHIENSINKKLDNSQYKKAIKHMYFINIAQSSKKEKKRNALIIII